MREMRNKVRLDKVRPSDDLAEQMRQTFGKFLELSCFLNDGAIVQNENSLLSHPCSWVSSLQQPIALFKVARVKYSIDRAGSKLFPEIEHLAQMTSVLDYLYKLLFILSLPRWFKMLSSMGSQY